MIRWSLPALLMFVACGGSNDFTPLGWGGKGEVGVASEDECLTCLEVLDDDRALQIISQAKAPSFTQPRLEVLVWNVEKGNNPAWDANMVQLSSRANMAVVQEALLDDDSTRTFRAIDGMGWDMAASYLGGENRDAPTGVATGSMARPLERKFIRSHPREPLTKTPKMVLLTTYELAWTDQVLLVVNVHGINFTLTTASFSEHMAQVEEAIKHHTGPMIFAGDFNAWGVPSQRPAVLVELAARQGLTHVELADDQRASLLKFDHVFIRGMKAIEATLLNAYKCFSDHAPIRLVVAFD